MRESLLLFLFLVFISTKRQCWFVYFTYLYGLFHAYGALADFVAAEAITTGAIAFQSYVLQFYAIIHAYLVSHSTGLEWLLH